MTSLAVRIMGIVGAATISLTMLGSGVASAWDPFSGKTYSEAASVITDRNGTPVIGTVTGSQLNMDDCIVSSWHVSKFLNSSGKNLRGSNFILNLNCTNDVATPGHPGNSAMSPQGAQAKKDQETAEQINKSSTWCKSNDQRLLYCQKLCKRTGLCEI